MRATIVVDGYVQGVGFRWWTMSQADRLGLVGFARNEYDGSVTVLAQGDEADVNTLIALFENGSAPGRICKLTVHRRADDDPRLTRFSAG